MLPILASNFRLAQLYAYSTGRSTVSKFKSSYRELARDSTCLSAPITHDKYMSISPWPSCTLDKVTGSQLLWLEKLLT
jgi:hypothetical protein